MTIDATHISTARPARRALLKSAAWTAPVLALAVAAPLAAASTTVQACEFTPVSWSLVPGSAPLAEDGAQGTAFGENNSYSTGWTPVGNTPGHANQSWWLPGPAAGGAIGFLSMADRNNSAFKNAPVDQPQDADPASAVPTTFDVVFTLQVKPGEHALQFPVFAGSNHLGRQYLDVSIEGAGIAATSIVKGYVGDLWNGGTSYIPEAYANGYSPLADEKTYSVTVAPAVSGTITATYTFTLMAVTKGEYKNADIWVQNPYVDGCAATAA